MTYSDPGWRPRGPTDRSVLSAIRALFIAMAVTPLMLLLIISFTHVSGSGGGRVLVAAAVVAFVGILSIEVNRRERQRPLRTESADVLLKDYRKTLFRTVTNAEYPAFAGILGYYFSRGRVWVYVVGMFAAWAALALMAPSKSEIARRQRQISDSGSGLDLLRVLAEATPGR